MKICILGNAQSIHNQRWCSELAKLGHDIYLITLHKHAEIPRVKVISFYSPMSRYLDIAFRLKKAKIKKLVKEIAPDILHGQYLSDYGYYASTLDFRPFVVSIWGSDILIYPDLKKKYFERVVLVLKKADRVTVEAKYLADHLRIRFKVPEKNIAVFPWGIREKIFNKKNKKMLAAALYKKYNIKPGSRVIFSPRSMAFVYGIYTIVGAIPAVLSKFPETVFVFARGYGNVQYIESIEGFINRSGLNKNIRILNSFVTSKEMAAWFSVSEAFVSSSYSDAISVSVLEGMASGCIPVLTNIDASLELVRNGYNGFIFKQKDPDSLATRLWHVLKLSAERRNKIAMRNALLVKKKYTLKSSFLVLEKVYRELAGFQ